MINYNLELVRQLGITFLYFTMLTVMIFVVYTVTKALYNLSKIIKEVIKLPKIKA